MILASLAHAGLYTPLHPLFAPAFAWVAEHGKTVTQGKHLIQGDDLYVMCERGVTLGPERLRFESHRRYIDVQVVMDGEEMMWWAPQATLRVAQAHADVVDRAFYHDPEGGGVPVLVRAGHFAVFFPTDAHKPICHPPKGSTSYRKLVFKVALQPSSPS